MSWLQTCENILCAYFVGSYTRTSVPHDIDILLIVENTNNILFKKNLQANFKLSYIFANDDSVSCEMNNIKFDFAFLTLSQFEDRVKKILQNQTFAEHRNWCVGYWLPEGFISDLRSAKIIFERDQIVRTYIDKFKDNECNINSTLIEEVKKEILFKSNLKTDLKYYNSIARNDVYVAFFRLINLKNRWGLTSFKHIVKKISSTKYSNTIEELMNTPDDDFKETSAKLLQEL